MDAEQKTLIQEGNQELAAALKTIKAGKAGGPDGVVSDITQTPFSEHAKRTFVNSVHPERELNYGMVPTGLANSNDCPVFKERERPTSCEQLSPYCSYVHHRKIAFPGE